ncbi:3-oxoacyl-ACP reductase FabG [Paenibacillus sp. GP183]|jgi:3-oxoacyl-[acyl-carrier protein] reductase|uniref:3-oxoacyl-ACP reductase FabG n=1 Tax=Paenibacillus sp. GP183 TaxID=1882751 RepID=UPI0008994C39|nr:3-oxoacyl-ACP reductase FabG [Paenibacillus sp. GP183]SEC62809.1 3-oxoacyl-[acyl-carrier-protein] reductase [Paenibacillus sp. GP183]
MRLQGKVALITGGGNGIGRETAALFIKEGAKVCVADYDETAGQAAVDELNATAGDRAIFVKVDVSSAESVERMIAVVLEHWGTPDILINNAGITQDSMLTKMSIEQWQRVIDVNLNGVFYCTRYLAPHMVQRGKGKIINTSSIVGVHGNIGQTNYAATKAGVIGMTKTWAKELGHKGIHVNAVAPGYIETSMVANVPEKVLQQMLDKVPLHRLGRPSDIAQAYLYLASDESDYVNGTVLEVNGGLVI